MAEITFYTNPQSRGRIVHWLLEELGVPYDMKILDFEKGDHKKPDYLKINPMGKVPAIVHRGVVVTEAAAICTYLADAYPKAGLAPALDDPRRGTYLRWLFFGAGCIEPAIVDKLFARPPVERKGARRLRQLRGHVERARDGLDAGAVHSRRTLQRSGCLRRRAGPMGFHGEGARAAAQVPTVRRANRSAAGAAEDC